MTRRSNRTRAFAPDPAAPGRPCDIPGCDELAGYRAPKSPTSLADYHWFCLDHVRAYNAKWDYYRGMTPGQIESELRADVTGRRPTWPLGRNGGGLEAEFGADPLDVLSEARLNRAKKYREKFTRDATPAELAVLRKGLDKRLATYAADATLAPKLLAQGLSKAAADLDPNQLAAWTATANILLNLDETVTRE